MSNLLTFLLAVMICLSLGGFASAATIDVGPGQSIQTAINSAANDDVIIVQPGTYVENIDMLGKAITLQSTDPLDLAIVTSTIIDGNLSESVITCSSEEDANTVISGFVITNGKANDGGGIYCYESSPTVNNCTFSGNIAKNEGGGMYNNSFSPTVSNCIFSGNTANDCGGGMYNDSSSPTVSNCIFSGNTATNDYGGGMYNDYSSPTVSNCTFCGNMANYYGGGMLNHHSSPTVTDCIFSGNEGGSGGGMYNCNSSPILTSSYFCLNTPSAIYGSYTDNGGNNLLFCPPPQPLGPKGDLDGDGDVDFEDFAIMANNWLVGTD